MSWNIETYHSRIYRDFLGISDKNFREQIHFYEKYEEDIKKLGLDEFLELLYTYANALFQVGSYRKYILVSDSVIELAFRYNIYTFQQHDLLEKTLFQKAAAHYNLREFSSAAYLLSELIKMKDTNRDALLFFKRCRQQQYPALRAIFRAVSIFLLLLCAGLIALEILFVRPFYEMYVSLVAHSRNTLFALGCMSMVTEFVYIRYLAEKDARLLLSQIRHTRSV